jgi:hypothetical protein
MSEGVTREFSDEHSTLLHIPMRLKKRGGRKQLIVPDGVGDGTPKPDLDVPFAIALARAHAWQELLDSGKYRSIREMARELGVCSTYMNRLLRFTILAPDIIEALLSGSESDTISQTKLTAEIPADWREQRERWGG